MPAPAPDQKPPGWLTARLADAVWRITPDCREVARLTSEGRDRPLPLGTRLRLGLHRSFCQWCARYLEQLDLIHEASRQLPAQHDGALPDDARARLKERLRTPR